MDHGQIIANDTPERLIAGGAHAFDIGGEFGGAGIRDEDAGDVDDEGEPGMVGDLNVIDVQWILQYRIEDPIRYLFAVRDTPQTIRDITEAVMRRVVGNRLGAAREFPALGVEHVEEVVEVALVGAGEAVVERRAAQPVAVADLDHRHPGGVQAAQYPLNIYAAWFRQVLTFGLPLACVAYYPVLAILKRPDPLGAPDWLLPLAPIAGFAFLALSFVAWRAGMARYASTGS
jgi:hypothetical protein